MKYIQFVFTNGFADFEVQGVRSYPDDTLDFEIRNDLDRELMNYGLEYEFMSKCEAERDDEEFNESEYYENLDYTYWEITEEDYKNFIDI